MTNQLKVLKELILSIIQAFKEAKKEYKELQELLDEDFLAGAVGKVQDITGQVTENKTNLQKALDNVPK